MTFASAGLTFSRSLLVAGLAGTIFIVPAVAQSKSTYPAEVIRKCRGDYNRLCPGYKPNSPSLDACMRSKHLSITSICMNALVDNGIAPPIARR